MEMAERIVMKRHIVMLVDCLSADNLAHSVSRQDRGGSRTNPNRWFDCLHTSATLFQASTFYTEDLSRSTPLKPALDLNS